MLRRTGEELDLGADVRAGGLGLMDRETEEPGSGAEAAPLSPANPYGASKLAGEVYVRAYAGMGGPAATILRLANVYGPGQRSDLEGGVIARFCAAAAAGAPARPAAPHWCARTRPRRRNPGDCVR